MFAAGIAVSLGSDAEIKASNKKGEISKANGSNCEKCCQSVGGPESDNDFR